MSKDLFSTQSAVYARYRPGYPAALIRYLLSFVGAKDIAWDCATGNGQAAILLSPYFRQVEATDLSQQQLAHAFEKENVHYAVSAAEQTPFPDNHFDLITVAQAYHWFRFEDFFKEAVRVGKNGCVVALWGYQTIRSGEPALDALLESFYSGKMGAYWDAERRWVDEAYETVPFYFEALSKERFRIFTDYSRAELLGYFNTWSSVQHYKKVNTDDPVAALGEQIAGLWPGDDKKSFYFPLFVRLGTIKK